jgi:cation:H+ antiporter
MSTWVWALVLLAAVWAAHWGAEHLAEPLKKLRRQWGFTAAAGGAFIGLAAASPEIGINTASAVRGAADIGLGASLGSNIIAIPLVVTVAYWASRSAQLGGRKTNQGASRQGDEAERPAAHKRHRQERMLRVSREGVMVQALPYLGLIGLFALLTLPAAWRGLQPLDGWLLLAGYIVYLGQALLRGRKKGETVEWSTRELGMAVAGVAVLALGAYFTVRATENLVSALGIPKIVGGLFITAPMAALPELFAVSSVTRSGQVTSATTSVIGDHAVTMTVAFLPLALVTLPIENLQLFWVNLLFVAFVPTAYAALIHLHWGATEHGFTLWEVFVLDGLLLVYLAIMLFGVLNVL